MNVGSLFTGVGGFDLGLERAGMRVAWQCESDEFCRRVLAKHWPNVPCYEDVRELREPPCVDLVCGGFPCQDISVAGRGAGIDGEQSGLWSEMLRVIRELRPRYVVVENVTGLLARGLGRVLGDLAAVGYDAEWDCIPAAAVGAPHRRDRVWLVAYPGGSGRWQNSGSALSDEGADEGRPSEDDHEPGGDGQSGRARPVGNTNRAPKDSHSEARGSWRAVGESGRWAAEPDVARMAHGVPDGLDRRRALGNALVPQIAEWIGRRILEWEEGVAA